MSIPFFLHTKIIEAHLNHLITFTLQKARNSDHRGYSFATNFNSANKDPSPATQRKAIINNYAVANRK